MYVGKKVWEGAQRQIWKGFKDFVGYLIGVVEVRFKAETYDLLLLYYWAVSFIF